LRGVAPLSDHQDHSSDSSDSSGPLIRLIRTTPLGLSGRRPPRAYPPRAQHGARAPSSETRRPRPWRALRPSGPSSSPTSTTTATRRSSSITSARADMTCPPCAPNPTGHMRSMRSERIRVCDPIPPRAHAGSSARPTASGGSRCRSARPRSSLGAARAPRRGTPTAMARSR
jgi:hypothetical protein